MRSKTIVILKKNLLLLARSKVSTTILFVGPLILVLFLGFGIAGQIDHVKLAYHLAQDIDQPEMVEIINTLKNIPGFTITESYNNVSCIDAVKSGNYHLCLIFEGIGKQTSLYVDIARTNLAYAILGTVSDSIEHNSEQIAAKLIEDLMDRMVRAALIVQNNTKNVEKIKGRMYLIPVKLTSIREGVVSSV
ncbi:MAG: hypothetical protein QF632_01200 [Candidatus Woesearchaeota archaeon]|jgi:hypothetical protein|nr:hypothetical protein [Candidatus Woesearchaeota archaeon]MDP7457127.1 hypothetical protein [Candidatus Woesearchaeota archaeon]